MFPVVVHGKNESVPSYDGDLVLQLSDLYHGFSAALLNYYFTVGDSSFRPRAIDYTLHSLEASRAHRGTSLCLTVAQSTASANGARITARSSTSRSSREPHSAPFRRRGLIAPRACSRNKTYRLRLINPGTFVAMQFSVDSHVLTVVEGDGTAVEPVQVSSVSVAVAQRYSVLLTTNQTAGAYWMRADLDQNAFTVSALPSGVSPPCVG